MIDSINSFEVPQCQGDSCVPQRGELARTKTNDQPHVEDSVHISSQGGQQLKAAAGQPSGMPGMEKLTAEQQREVQRLKQKDQEVKAHERAHMAAGAGVVMGGASYQYQRGPDGKMYAVGGEVKIDTSRENSPEATIGKMQQVKRAALAPAQPSGQDRSVAAQAAQFEAEARIELTQQKQEKVKEEKAKREESTEKFPTGNLSIPHHKPHASSPVGSTINIKV
jgi:hypothetical protein